MSPFYSRLASCQSRENSLAASGIILESPLDSQSKPIDLIDLIWPADERDPKPNGPLKIHEAKFAGISIKIFIYSSKNCSDCN